MWASVRPLLGIFSQNAGPACKVWANPVDLACLAGEPLGEAGRGGGREQGQLLQPADLPRASCQPRGPTPPAAAHDALGFFGTTLKEKIGVFRANALKMVPISPNASCSVGRPGTICETRFPGLAVSRWLWHGAGGLSWTIPM
jgi:hypothetical protein